jgi:hypothetical protein
LVDQKIAIRVEKTQKRGAIVGRDLWDWELSRSVERGINKDWYDWWGRERQNWRKWDESWMVCWSIGDVALKRDEGIEIVWN